VPKPPKKILNQNVIDQWPEIFADIDLSAIPLDYLHTVTITFKDGNQWNVVIEKKDRDLKDGNLPRELTELFNNYEKQILNVDFQLDIPQIKKDVVKSTKKFLRGRK
jgi:hypothetical protein